jgi:hypothetical protein
MPDEVNVDAGVAPESSTPEPTTPEGQGAEANESTAPQSQGWVDKFQGLDDFEKEQLKGLLGKAVYTDKHGKTGREFVFDADALFDTVGKGLDAESKTQAAAEALRLQEFFQQNQPQLEAAIQIADYLQSNPLAAQQFAEVIGQIDPDSVGFIPQTPAEAAMYQQLQQYQQFQEQLQQFGQQQQMEAYVGQLQQQLMGDMQRISEANPDLFDESVAGPKARLNRWKLQKAAEEASASGYYNKDLMDYAFHKTFGKQLDQQTVSRYLNGKQRGAPSVGTGGRPSSGGKQELTKEQYFARGRARLMGDAYRG